MTHHQQKCAPDIFQYIPIQSNKIIVNFAIPVQKYISIQATSQVTIIVEFTVPASIINSTRTADDVSFYDNHWVRGHLYLIVAYLILCNLTLQCKPYALYNVLCMIQPHISFCNYRERYNFLSAYIPSPELCTTTIVSMHYNHTLVSCNP